ncbi:transcriptional regulator, TetR family protein [Mycobacterium xenopi 4042]|uniref:Transcriptional regulator, TetR family protein n=1 Tax=Mycobacterium xenopi 4042 TaxID=1299334 RepID=X7Z4C2_MYCXE|nr:transcriptional regulator, TetR family protein [Mycobacterium xenopi 4042]
MAADVRAMVAATRDVFISPVVRAALPGLIADMTADSELNARVMSRFGDLFAAVRLRLRDGVARGEVHPDVDPDRLIELIGGRRCCGYCCGRTKSLTTTGSTRQPRSWCTASKWGRSGDAGDAKAVGRRRSCLRLRPGGAWLSSPRAILTTSTHSVTRKEILHGQCRELLRNRHTRCRCYDGFLQRVVRLADRRLWRLSHG